MNPAAENRGSGGRGGRNGDGRRRVGTGGLHIYVRRDILC